MIPYSQVFDQQTMTRMLDHDPVVQRYRSFFALFDWSVVPEPVVDPSQPGKRPHPPTAYIKALLLKLEEGLTFCTRLRRFLLEHPLLVLELGFRPVLDWTQPYGFDVQHTVPTARWLREQQRTLSQGVLQTLLLRTVEELREEIPGLGEVVSFDVTHIYAWVRENNPRVYVQGTFDVTHIPKGDPDCRLGVKKSTNQEQPDGTKVVKKESLFGYGSGTATCTDPVYGDIVLAEYTQPFNEGDITYFPPLYFRTVATLGFFPTHLAADAAFDAWYCYQGTASRHGIARVGAMSMACRCAPKACAWCLPSNSTTPMAIVRNAFAARCSSLRRPNRPAISRSFSRRKGVSKTSTGRWVDRCASHWTATVHSSRPSIASGPVPSAATATPKPWA